MGGMGSGTPMPVLVGNLLTARACEYACPCHPAEEVRRRSRARPVGNAHPTGARISQLPQNDFEPYQPPAAPVALTYALPPQRPRLSVIISWLVIWGAVALIAGLPYLLKRERVVETSNLQLKFAGRYIVGLKAFLPQILSTGNSKQQFHDMVRQAALTPQDDLRAIPILVELDGVEAAGRLLDQFDANNTSPDLASDAEILRAIYEKGVSAIDEAQKKRLLDRHEWFGQLALSYNQPSDSPARRAAIAPAKRVIVAVGTLLTVGGISFLIGLGLLIWFLVRLINGSRPREVPPGAPAMPYGYVDPRPEPVRMGYVPDPAAPPAFLEAFAIYLGGFLALGILIRVIFPNAGLGLMVLALALPLIAAIYWPRRRGLSWEQIRIALGWHRGNGIWREVISGLAGYIAGLPILAVAMMLTLVLTRFGGKVPSHPIVNEISIDFWSVIKLYLLASVWAPVTEELLFRGAFFHHLRRRHGWFVSSALISFIFAAIHPQGYLGIPMLMTIALILAALREWRGSIIAPIVGHALNNFVATTVLIFMLG
jgi:membrane protease YdiL (CAAX protease family)